MRREWGAEAKRTLMAIRDSRTQAFDGSPLSFGRGAWG